MAGFSKEFWCAGVGQVVTPPVRAVVPDLPFVVKGKTQGVEWSVWIFDGIRRLRMEMPFYVGTKSGVTYDYTLKIMRARRAAHKAYRKLTRELVGFRVYSLLTYAGPGLYYFRDENGKPRLFATVEAAKHAIALWEREFPPAMHRKPSSIIYRVTRKKKER